MRAEDRTVAHGSDIPDADSRVALRCTAMKALRHLVLFHIKPDIPEAEVDAALAGLAALAHEPGVLEWTVCLSLDTRKGPVIVENALFVDDAALQAFRVSEAHAESAARLARIADWVVGDYWEPRDPG